MSEKFCLKWNDFHSNVSKSFGLLRNENYLHDVTLVSDDHHQVSAHKLVLSACSEYFKDLFKHNNKTNAHLLLCLDGITSHDLNSIMDYIYNGEVQIYQDNLDRFLSIAQRLKLEGLIGNEDTSQDDSLSSVHEKLKVKEKNVAEQVQVSVQHDTNYEKGDSNYGAMKVARMEKPVISISPEDVSELENTINQHMELCEDGRYKCTLCGKMQKEKGVFIRALKNHIETHLDGLSFPCQLCGKTFRSRNAYSIHKTRNHK